MCGSPTSVLSKLILILSRKVNYTLLSTVSRDVRAEIIDQIESLQPDMLVLGSRGLGALSGLVAVLLSADLTISNDAGGGRTYWIPLLV